MAYQPAPGSPGQQKKDDGSDSDDPLDAFMADIEVHSSDYCKLLKHFLFTRILLCHL